MYLVFFLNPFICFYEYFTWIFCSKLTSALTFFTLLSTNYSYFWSFSRPHGLWLVGPNLAQNVVFRLFLQNALLKVHNFCHRHFMCSLLLGKPTVYAEKIWIAQNLTLLGPNLALYGTNLAQNVVFRLFIQNVAFNVPIFGPPRSGNGTYEIALVRPSVRSYVRSRSQNPLIVFF